MKLLAYVAIAASSALVNARSADNAECKDSKSFKRVMRSGSNISAKDYDANFDANLHKYLLAKTSNSDASTKCSEMVETCNALLDHPDMEAFRSGTGGSSNCGKQADETIDTVLGCYLCEQLKEQEDADEYCIENAQSQACVSRSAMGVNCENTPDNLACAYQQQAENTSTENDDKADDYECDSNDMECASRKTSKSKQQVSIILKRCTGKIWNVVVSGGPEYCRDMLPKYPRVNYGKMTPNNPNYAMVVEIRDACVALGNIVKQTRCFCLYVLWGSSSYPRPSNGPWKAAKASKKEANVCWYFSNLKGTGVYKPKTRPSDIHCGKTHNYVVNIKNPNQTAQPISDAENKVTIFCKKQFKRLRGNKKKKAVLKCKKANKNRTDLI
jgi:hypothetical protein